jgi:hypothetical protein
VSQAIWNVHTLEKQKGEKRKSEKQRKNSKKKDNPNTYLSCFAIINEMILTALTFHKY